MFQMFIKLTRNFEGFREEIGSDMSLGEIELPLEILILPIPNDISEIMEVGFDIRKNLIFINSIFGLHIGIKCGFLVHESRQDTELHPGIWGGNLHEFLDINPPFGEQMSEHEVHDMHGRLDDGHELVMLPRRKFNKVRPVHFPEIIEKIPFFSRSYRIEGDILREKRRDPRSEHRMGRDHFTGRVSGKCLRRFSLDSGEIQEELS